MNDILQFIDAESFRKWLENNHKKSKGITLFIFKKGYGHLGISYDDAVRVALCYGWIDSITHKYDEEKFLQYFSPRKKNSHWSLSNLLRMKELIEGNEMTDYGLGFFAVDSLQELIDEKIKQKNAPITIPHFFEDLLLQENAMDLFVSQTPGIQKRYLQYILEGKQKQTQLRRCNKIISDLKAMKSKE